MTKRSTKVFVGLSGGVDSSVTASLLVEAGYQVIGVYMKNWSQDLPGMRCPWAEDLADAKRVAVDLGIPLRVYDFEDEYRERVVDYMLREYQAGRTPNPDIMCNQEVKFKLFLETALAEGADLIATGHYAQSVLGSRQSAQLLRAKDETKDQTYFLYRISETALAQTLFPLGELLKTEVRLLAKERGLVTASKKDSMGICFIGQAGIKEFLGQYIDLLPGPIIDQDSQEQLGYHQGAVLYTIGQRHGLELGGGLPYYVVAKDIKQNIVFVSRNLNQTALWTRQIHLADLHWIDQVPLDQRQYLIRVRHQAPLIKAKLCYSNNDTCLILETATDIRAVTDGQSVVIYDDQICLGGGIVHQTSSLQKIPK